MADFVQAFKAGIAAAKAAEAARNEIDEIFMDVDRQIREGSEGKLSIARGTCYVGPELLKGVVKSWENLAKIMGGTELPRRESYPCVLARNPTIPKSQEIELAKFYQNINGYPCKIVWHQNDISCYDGESLQRTLVSLLQSPDVGEKLMSLMSLEPPVAQELQERVNEVEAVDEAEEGKETPKVEN